MFKLIPRVRVNYSFLDLCRGLIAGRGQGVRHKQLRETICKYFDVEDVLLTSSGRASIYMLLKHLPHSKVIVPAYTCKVVIEAALLAGKEVIYAPTSRHTFNITSLPDLDSDCIVIATHQYGIPCDIESICDECRKYGAIVIEDCAASLGTRVNGKLTGLFGHYGIFSFDSSKLITVPSKGGFIIARDCRELKSIEETTPVNKCSNAYKFKHIIRGLIYVLLKSPYLYRVFHYVTMERKGQMQLDNHSDLNLSLGEFYTHGFYEWQAVVALPQFKKIDAIIDKRQHIYSKFNNLINSPIVKKPPYVQDSACIRYAILVRDKESFYRETIKKGVDMGFSFNSIASPNKWIEEHLISHEVLNIPYYYNLSDKEQDYIIKVINSIKAID